MIMNDAIGRRGFLGKTASAAVALPLMLEGGSKPADANSGQPSEVSQAKPKVKKIAVEEHWTPFNVIEAAGMKAGPNAERQADLGDIRLGEMDAGGITMQVIANSSYQALTDTAKAIDLAKRNNDYLAEAIAKHPDRFAGLAALPTQDPKAAADELERAVKQLKLKGAMIEGQDHAHWEYLDSQKFWGLWERADALEVPIYLHPYEPSPDSLKVLEGHPELQSLMWAGAFYTASHALRLIGSGVFDAFPKATVILGHLGELLPYWFGRLGSGIWKGTKKPPYAYIKENMYVTTSGNYEPEALVCAIGAMGIERVLFAIDYPWGKGERAIQLVENTPMSDADREKIYHLNAERLFRL
jgi:predicted TIM-barrel fold metal-dependent hydrolase